MVKFNLNTVWIPLDSIECNSFNPNELENKEYQQLIESIRKDGFTGFIIVRDLENGKYQLIDGAHRHQALKQLGEEQAPCIVQDSVSEIDARLGCIKMNVLRGTSNPKKLGHIFKFLQEHNVSNRDISEQLPYDEPIIQDDISLLDLPDNIQDLVKEQAEKESNELPCIWSFIVKKEYNDYIEKALNYVGLEHKGECFGLLCKKIVDNLENGTNTHV